MSKPKLPDACVPRSSSPPSGQEALQVQHFPAALAAGRNCTQGGPAARKQTRGLVGPFQPPSAWEAVGGGRKGRPAGRQWRMGNRWQAGNKHTRANEGCVMSRRRVP
eukprot:7342753-Alexandrium_andersonii.AAC.1